MENQSVYTLSNAEEVGAFQEETLSATDALRESSARVDAMMADLLGSMKTLSEDEDRRKQVGRRLV